MKTTPKNMPGITGISGTIPDYTNNHLHIPGAAFFNKTFGINGTNGTQFKKVTNALINQAMVGTYPNTTISYPGLTVSKVPLPGPDSPNAVVNYDGYILFSWSDNSGIKTAKPNDKVILVTYFPATNKIIHTLHAATRRSGQALLHVNKMNGFAVETWIGFVSDDERDAADSVYAGRVIL